MKIHIFSEVRLDFCLDMWDTTDIGVMRLFTRVRLKNFRSFDEIELDLTSRDHAPKHLVTVFGENGAGKSNLMSAFSLLNELIATMDVRDAYEELLSHKNIFSDENLEKAVKQKLLSGFRDMSAIINDYRMIGNDDPTYVEYEFSICGSIGTYYVEFDEKEIIRERLSYLLNQRKGTYFDCSREKISINSAIVADKDLFSDIRAVAKRFWGKHSLLAIIQHEIFDKSSAFAEGNLSRNFMNFFSEVWMLSCYIGIGARRWEKLNARYVVLEHPDQGDLPKKDEYQLDIAERIFTLFFSSINCNIHKAYYYRRNNDKFVNYQLFFEKKIAGAYRTIPFSMESTGNHQLLHVLCFLLSACLGETVVIDEADSGIHDLLFQKIIQEICPYIAGQVILTSHNTMLMQSDFARESTYILKEDDKGTKSVQCITDYDKRTYINNSIRNKYLNNEYGGIPRVQPIDFEQVINELRKGMVRR